MADTIVALLLGIGSTIVAGFVYPYLMTAIAYRKRDNGLAYIVLLMGTGVWNGMFVGQLLSTNPAVELYFHTLMMVGVSIAAVGWFLFASTANSTPTLPYQRLYYGVVAIVIGLNISVVVTNPLHSVYWVVSVESANRSLMLLDPSIGYWLHTTVVASLFVAGGLLFGIAWGAGIDTQYTRAYTIVSLGLAAVLMGDAAVFSSEITIAPLLAGVLMSIGWYQAHQKLPKRDNPLPI